MNYGVMVTRQDNETSTITCTCTVNMKHTQAKELADKFQVLVDEYTQYGAI